MLRIFVGLSVSALVFAQLPGQYPTGQPQPGQYPQGEASTRKGSIRPGSIHKGGARACPSLR